MFRTVFPSINRISRLHTQHQVYVIQVSWPPVRQSTNLYDIYLMPYVQSWNPVDGRKDRPKLVEWHSINSKILHLVDFTTETYHDARSHERQIYCVFCISPTWKFKHSNTTQPFVPSYSRLTTQLEYTVMAYLNNDTDYDRPALCYCSHYLDVTGKVNNKITSQLAYKR